MLPFTMQPQGVLPGHAFPHPSGLDILLMRRSPISLKCVWFVSTPRRGTFRRGRGTRRTPCIRMAKDAPSGTFDFALQI